MRILVLADIHSRLDKLGEIVEAAQKEKFDLVVCAGNLTDSFDSPLDLEQVDIADMVVQKLMLLKKSILCIPGNHDPYEIVDLFEDYGVNLHDRSRKAGGLVFIGFGGAETPFNTLFEPSDPEIKEGLEYNSKNLQVGKFITVVHNPPKETKMDKVISGEHVGSKAVRDFVLEKKPQLCISANIHEGAGEDKLGDTVLFYPGPVVSGKYGIVEINGDKVKAEIKSVEKPKEKKAK